MSWRVVRKDFPELVFKMGGFIYLKDSVKLQSCPKKKETAKVMLGAGALGQPRGMDWGGRREEGSGWGTHVYLWWIHFDIWQN